MTYRDGRSLAMGVGLSASVLVWSSLASADPVVVYVAVPGVGDSVPNEITNRVRGELAADGFRVEVMASTADGGRVDSIRQSARGFGAAFAGGIFVDGDAGGVEIDMVEVSSGRASLRHLDVSHEEPQVVARHAVGLFRANLLDFVVSGLKTTPVEPPAPPASVPEPAKEPTSTTPNFRRFALEGGVGLLGSFSGVGAAIVPVLRIRYAASHTIQIRLIGAGFGSTPTVQSQFGTATVQQGVAQFDALVHFVQSWRVRPFAAMGAGAYYAEVTGSGIPPFAGRKADAVALGLSASVGATVSIAQDAEISFELQAVMTEPAMSVRLVDDDAGRLGRPLLLGTLTVAGWL